MPLDPYLAAKVGLIDGLDFSDLADPAKASRMIEFYGGGFSGGDINMPETHAVAAELAHRGKVTLNFQRLRRSAAMRGER